MRKLGRKQLMWLQILDRGEADSRGDFVARTKDVELVMYSLVRLGLVRKLDFMAKTYYGRWRPSFIITSQGIKYIQEYEG